MVSSMTGFGRGSAARDGREITIELKSVNHRYLDPSFRMPRHISFIEDALRAELTKKLSRGHVEGFVNYRNTRSDARRVEIDEGLLSAYLKSARTAAEKLSLTDDITLSAALKLPDVSSVVEADEDAEAVVSLAVEALDKALDGLRRARADEGARLSADLLSRLDSVSELRLRISERAPLVVSEYKQRLDERIAQLTGEVEVDRQRLATEVAIFADKASIDEELVRLQSHVTAMRAALLSDEPMGRKLDFMVQEMNREFNTIGSKANDAGIASLVITAKAEIEKLREQIQNIE